MGYETILLNRENGIGTITLNRPESYNAVNMRMGEELLDAVHACDEDPGVRAVIVTGAGSAFCAGGDVKEFGERVDKIGIHLKRLTTFLHGAISRLARMPKPVVVAVNGVAAGAGMSLALACDLTVAAESARFTMAYSRIGATPDGSSTYFLPRLVGLKRALELTFTNRVLNAREAEAWGLVSRVIPDGEFSKATRDLASELAAGPTLALGRAKRLYYLSEGETLETQMENEAQYIAASGRTADFHEGIAAFAEKRKPVFRGR